ncbi:uncharacterized protein GLRG_09824, partial [Colletotrichum graminicola M1.001]
SLSLTLSHSLSLSLTLSHSLSLSLTLSHPLSSTLTLLSSRTHPTGTRVQRALLLEFQLARTSLVLHFPRFHRPILAAYTN